MRSISAVLGTMMVLVGVSGARPALAAGFVGNGGAFLECDGAHGTTSLRFPEEFTSQGVADAMNALTFDAARASTHADLRELVAARLATLDAAQADAFLQLLTAYDAMPTAQFSSEPDTEPLYVVLWRLLRDSRFGFLPGGIPDSCRDADGFLKIHAVVATLPNPTRLVVMSEPARRLVERAKVENPLAAAMLESHEFLWRLTDKPIVSYCYNRVLLSDQFASLGLSRLDDLSSLCAQWTGYR